MNSWWLPISSRQDQPMDNICFFLQLCLAYEGKVYQQIHGTTMGSPVSLVVENLVMEDVEQEALSTFHTPHGLQEICGWHMHSIPLWPGRHFHDHLNSINPAYSSPCRSRVGSSPSLTSSWTGKKMAPSSPLCIIRSHTQMSICIFILTTLQPTNELWWGHHEWVVLRKRSLCCRPSPTLVDCPNPSIGSWPH